MAGKLVQVSTTTVSGTDTEVTLTGIDSDNVYMLVVNNLTTSADNTLRFRLTYDSGTPDSSANYDRALISLRSDTTFGNTGTRDYSYYTVASISTIANHESMQSIYYLFNMNKSDEYSVVFVEDVFRNTAGNTRSNNGGFVLDVDRAHDGIQFYTATTTTITSGTLTLYKVI